MAKDINIFTPAWRELVFEGKNKEYGAYRLRKNSSRYHLLAFVIVVAIALFIASLPSLLTLLQFAGKDKEESRVTELSAILDEKPQEEEQNVIATPPPPELKTTIRFTPPVIAADNEVSDEDEIKTQDQLAKTSAQISVRDVLGSDSKDAVDIAETDAILGIKKEQDERVIDIAEQMPAFVGGTEKLMAWLQSELRFPAAAAERGISGTVYVQFTVWRDGSIRDIKIARSPDPVFDKEAIRVVQKMPKWSPGRQRGQAVNVRFTLPINFNLQ